MSERYQVQPLTPIRKIIAARMTEAVQTIPQFRLTVDLEMDALAAARARLLAAASDSDQRVSLTDLLIKSCAMALMDVPGVNIQWADTAIHQFVGADISLMISLPAGGIVAPVLRNAQAKSVWEISRETKDFATRAQCNALKQSELTGGSFSISNLGMLRVDEFDAIVNPPQCAILAVGKVGPKVAVGEQRLLRVITAATVTLTCDHRAIDGALGAAFLTALRNRVEKPDYLE